jgi:hypothetical protein
MKGRTIILCLAVALALPLGGSAAAGEADVDNACTWGASSVVAEIRDGEVVVSQAETTGCIP